MLKKLEKKYNSIISCGRKCTIAELKGFFVERRVIYGALKANAHQEDIEAECNALIFIIKNMLFDPYKPPYEYDNILKFLLNIVPDSPYVESPTKDKILRHTEDMLRDVFRELKRNNRAAGVKVKMVKESINKVKSQQTYTNESVGGK